MMTVKRDSGFETNDEVDEVRWVDLAGATDLLSYERDRALLAAFAASDDLDTLLV